MSSPSPSDSLASRRFVVLHGNDSSLVVEFTANEAPLWRYWGPRLPDTVTPGWWLRETRYTPPSSLEEEQPLTVMPTFGVGAFTEPALLAHRGGLQFAQHFTRCRIEAETVGHSVAFVLDDTVAGIEVRMEFKLDAHDVLRIATSLRNVGSDAIDIQWLAAGTLPLPATSHAVRSFHGQWATEFQWRETPLGQGQWVRENQRGRTSHDSFPGAIVLEAGAGQHNGVVYGAHLAWSGNHRQSIEARDDGTFQWQLGEWLAPGEVLLAAGEALAAPTLYAACSTRGLNGLAASFHAAVRAVLPWPNGSMKPRPVHLNTWEAIYFDHRMDDLLALAEHAAEVGIERFVLDDGWFHGRHSDRAALGDWWPDASKFPHGLAPLAERVNALGMEFGLWVEPEMVSPDSELFRAHPDWALQLEGRPLLTGRNQLVLDVARPEVGEYLFARLDAILRTTPIGYLKWDMNRDLTTAGSGGRAAYRVQVDACYRLMDRLRAHRPQLEIEACSSGGARADIGILAHTHRLWTSDCNDARSRIGIQRGALQFFPPEILGAHIGPAPSHTTGRGQSLDFRAAVALPCHLGVEADIRHLDDGQRQRLAGWIALYKRLRNRLHSAPVMLGDAGDGIAWQAHGDAGSALLFVYRLDPTQQRFSPNLRMPWVEDSHRYRLRRVDSDLLPHIPGWGDSPLHDALSTAGGASFDGAWLRRAGLPLPRLTGESALMLEVVATK